MRKNKMMRLASALLIAVLLTTCAISGTFAKYTTTGTGTDSATVAKWGVVITANGSSFAKQYATDDAGVVGTIANSVVGTNKVIAPGTQGTMVAATISGTPEVAVKVTYEATVTLTGWTVNTDTYYCPLEITVGTGEDAHTYKGTSYESAAKFKEAIETAINGYSDEYAPNTNLGTITVPVSWKWAFEGNDDVKDTALAKLETAPTIKIEVQVTVTQID